MRLALVVVLAGCGVDPTDEAFGFLGQVEDLEQSASTIGLWIVSEPPPVHTYKLGDGSAVVNQFDISFDTEPPEPALNAGGFGVAQIGLLPGLATVPDGSVDVGNLRLIGLTTNHAVVFKRPGATGPAWVAAFPDGFSCGRCVRGPIDELEPTPCALVVAERVIVDPCVWY
jgi:hypothetical protein